MSVFYNNALVGASGQAAGGYKTERSLRFNSADSAYLSRTPASAGNRTVFTFSCWVKKIKATNNYLFSAQTDANNYSWIKFDDTSLQVQTFVGGIKRADYFVNAAFRDPSAWYHLLLSSNGTSGISVWINGVSQAVTVTTALSASYSYEFNNTVQHRIGDWGGYYTDNYLADVHWIDGQALTPTSFGEFDTNNVWQPKKYSGPTPTGNSFWLPFSDNSAATATTLGKDGFLLGNNWTPVNLSVNNSSTVYSSGAAYLGNGILYSGSPAGMFGGGGGWGVTFNASSGASLTNGGRVTFPTPLTNVTSIIANVRTPNLYNATIFVNNNSSGINIPQNQADVDINITAALTGSSTPTTFSSITFGPTTWDGYLRINYLVVNGVRLTDSTFNFQNDSLVDSPSNYGTDTGAGGSVRGNYCTLNPLHKYLSTASNGNLDCTSNAGWIGSTIHMNTGKWYAEFTVGSTGTVQMFGICTSTHSGTGYPWQATTPNVTYYASGGRIYVDGVNTGNTTGSIAGDIISLAFDVDAKSVVIRKNNTIISTKTIGTTSSYMFYISDGGTSTTSSVNFGQRQWAFAPPAGFKALCTQSLPPATITNGATAMDVKLYTGTGASQTITGLGFSPDFIWTKARSVANSHFLYDVLRVNTGSTPANKPYYLRTDTTAAESASVGITSFDSNGFTLDGNSSTSTLNATYAAWCWDAGSSTVTNTSGTISSQVRANASAGFSVVTYTGTGANATVGHGLGVAPQLILVKCRDVARQWFIYSAAVGATRYLQLSAVGSVTSSTAWNNTAPTSTVFSLGGLGGVNALTETHVAYCWAPVASYSSFGSYDGNGSTDGPFVYTGFRPRWILIKATNAAENWNIIDTARSPGNVVTPYFDANTSSAEGSYPGWDILSNGFKLRNIGGTLNTSGITYIYACFAENPFALARAR